jgi:hypothetical protein
MFDAAGHCFASPLGQAVFDNADCRPGAVTLGPFAAARVARLQAEEAALGCTVATGAGAALDLPAEVLARPLIDHPVLSEFESACVGWTGTPLTLSAAIGADAPVIGTIRPGDTILYRHMSEPDWEFVETSPGGAFGWIAAERIPSELCEMVAG